MGAEERVVMKTEDSRLVKKGERSDRRKD